jgi:hypothetical protein
LGFIKKVLKGNEVFEASNLEFGHKACKKLDSLFFVFFHKQRLNKIFLDLKKKVVKNNTKKKFCEVCRQLNEPKNDLYFVFLRELNFQGKKHNLQDRVSKNGS